MPLVGNAHPTKGIRLLPAVEMTAGSAVEMTAAHGKNDTVASS